MGNLDHLPLAQALERVLGVEQGRVDRGSTDGMTRLLQRCLDYVQHPLQEVALMKIGRCMRRLRELRHVTMGQVARTMNVTVTDVSNWELDRAPMSDDTQRRYFDAVFASNLSSRAHDAREIELLGRNTALVNELRRVDHERQVREFHTAVVGHTLPDYPGVPPEAVMRRQLRLITEEYLELMESAFGKIARLEGVSEALGAMIDSADVELSVDFIELMDAAADLEYVNLGLFGWCGVDGHGVFAVVHASNMAKAGGPKRESDGKMLKPPGWKPPDIAAEIERQKAEALARQRGPK